jgi:uncharacterized protein
VRRFTYISILPMLVCAFACARGSSDPVDDGLPIAPGADAAFDGGTPTEGTVLPDGAVLLPDGAVVERDAAIDDAGSRDATTGPPDADLPDGGCTSRIVINEVRAEGAVSSTDEFVEIHNPSSCEVAVGNWVVEYRSRNGTTPTALYRFPAGAKLPANGYFLLAGVGFNGAKDTTFSFTLDATGGQIGILDGARVVDGVGYGNASAGHVETTAALVPPGGQSIARKPGGIDTNNNAADFQVQASTPRGPNPP